MASFIPEAYRSQLAGVFERFDHNVQVMVHYDSSDLGKELCSFMEEFGALTDKVIVSKVPAELEPGIELCYADGSPAGIIYHAVPGGHEFNSFILALYNVAGPGKAIDPDTESRAGDITERINIKIVVTLSCHNCPEVVQAYQRLSVLSDNISTEIYDANHFMDMVDRYNIQGVPCMILGGAKGEKIHFAKKPFAELFSYLEKYQNGEE